MLFLRGIRRFLPVFFLPFQTPIVNFACPEAKDSLLLPAVTFTGSSSQSASGNSPRSPERTREFAPEIFTSPIGFAFLSPEKLKLETWRLGESLEALEGRMAMKEMHEGLLSSWQTSHTLSLPSLLASEIIRERERFPLPMYLEQGRTDESARASATEALAGDFEVVMSTPSL